MPEQNENIRNMWSDDELDRALSALHPAEAADERPFQRAKADLLVAAGAREPAPEAPRAPRRRGRWMAAVGTVAAMVAGVLVVQTIQAGDHIPNAAAEQLNSAASKIDVVDEPLGPGEYRYVATHAWWLRAGEGHVFLAENLLEKWVPDDDNQPWLERSHETGAYRWVAGDEEAAKHQGLLPKPGQPQSSTHPSCGRDCGWQVPSHAFLAGLPRDTDELYDRLRADTDGRGPDPDLEMVVYVADVLRSGMVPADLRAALYRVLGLVPGLEITEQVANLDGVEGTAYGVSANGRRHDVIIDPKTGQFIGERQISENDSEQIPAGTVTSYTSVTTAAAPTSGVRPS